MDDVERPPLHPKRARRGAQADELELDSESYHPDMGTRSKYTGRENVFVAYVVVPRK